MRRLSQPLKRAQERNEGSGIDLIGVAQAPTCPVESFTPVKKRPTTARSIVIRPISFDATLRMVSIVSAKILLTAMNVSGA